MSETRFNASNYIGETVLIEGNKHLASVPTVYGPKPAYSADVTVGDEFFADQLIFNTGIVSDLIEAQQRHGSAVLRGVLTNVTTKSGRTAIVVK